MKYNIVADKIEVRSIKSGDKPRYIVNGTAIVANKKHLYDYAKNKDGSVKTLKNLFTPHCIASIKEQAKHKTLFVDTQHELVRDASIKSILKGKLNSEEQKQVDTMMKRKELPISKITDIDISGDSLNVYTELNPVFREVDEDHQKYFDAVWYSLENKYLNGISINFADAKVALDDNGDKLIDDIDILGFSYVDSPAGYDHSIYEVAIRAIGDGINEGEQKMEEEKVKLDAEKAKLEEEKKQIAEEKATIAKQKETEEVQKQKDAQKKIEDDLVAKTEEARKVSEENAKLKDELNSAKGVVKQIPPPSQQKPEGKNYDEKFYGDNLKDITSGHDETMEIIKRGQKPMIDKSMSGFGKLVNLQSKISPTAGMDKQDAEYAKEHRLLDRSDGDIVAIK